MVKLKVKMARQFGQGRQVNSDEHDTQYTVHSTQAKTVRLQYIQLNLTKQPTKCVQYDFKFT